MMKTYFIPVILGLFVACNQQSTSSQGSIAISDEDYEILTNLKKVSLAKAYDEQDTVLLERILHEKYQLVDDGGLTYSKRDELEYVAKYASSYDELSFDIKKLEIFENGTAMLFGEGSIIGTDMQGAYSMTYKSTDVFVKERGEWKAISSHVSGVKEIRE